MKSLIMSLFVSTVHGASITIGTDAPAIELQTDQNEVFKLSDRKGKWTVLFFYPKADTPGCTKQACAFRDSLDVLKKEGIEVFGISADNVESLKKFKQKYSLNFPLLADPEYKAIKAYGTKMPLLPMSRRWTFIIDPNLKIASIDKDVDPVQDAKKVLKKIQDLSRENK